MPWNSKFANYLVIAQTSGLITSDEYETIRAALELKQKIADSADGAAPQTLQAMNRGDAGRPISDSIGSLAEAKTVAKHKFGTSSNAQLTGVIPGLVQVARLAIQISDVDFCVYEGVRTLKEQMADKAKGTSQTLDSYHLPQKDGYGHALDLVPWIDGKPVWDWKGCYMIAYAMDIAATQLKCASMITWGAAWDRTLADFGSDLGSYEQEMNAYAKRHPGKDFVDGPHFQWKR